MRGVNYILVAFSCLFNIVSTTSQAANSVQGWGRVNMQGSIIDAACAIAVKNSYQTVDMAVVPVNDIIRDGPGETRSLSIELSNCELQHPNHQLPDWQHFQIIFDGDAEGELFAVQGAASGVALQIRDAIGNIVRPGKPLPLENITPGSTMLNYTIKLVANSHALQTGEYFSAVRFKLDYF